jgi:Endonuclease NucS C-terminal domain
VANLAKFSPARKNDMADVDAFGLRLGSKVSMVAALAARPQGASMREIIEATGDGGSKYNILTILRAKGHKVDHRGNRYFLTHKDPFFTPKPVVSEVEQWLPLPERRLQTALRGNLDKLEPGLVAVDGGREDRDRDITAKDRAGNTVVIELKVGRAGTDAIIQLQVYMGKMKAAKNPSGLRGILVARDFSTNAVAAASMVPNITLRRWGDIGVG